MSGLACFFSGKSYSQNISVICAFGMTTAELTKEIGEELVRKLPSVRDNNPSLWTPVLERYIDTTLKVNIRSRNSSDIIIHIYFHLLQKTGNDFRQAVLDHVSDTGNELFKSYCEKVLLDL